jgi:hypothetical protein
MHTVPAFIAPLVLGEHAQALNGCGVRLVGAVELDLDAVAERAGDGVAAALADYFEACRLMWADRLDGSGPRGPFVAIRRTVVRERQSTTSSKRSAKKDLAEPYEQLCKVAVLGPLFKAFLEPGPDWDDLSRAGQVFALSFVPDTGSRAPEATLMTAHLAPGQLPYGPPPTPAEVRRVLEVVANHATWRDCGRRRLVSVTVHVDEIWPDPSAVVDMPSVASSMAELDHSAGAPTV